MDKIDYHIKGCNHNDEDKNNDCWNCTRFCFPIGCMVGIEDDDKEEN